MDDTWHLTYQNLSPQDSLRTAPGSLFVLSLYKMCDKKNMGGREGGGVEIFKIDEIRQFNELGNSTMKVIKILYSK